MNQNKIDLLGLLKKKKWWIVSVAGIILLAIILRIALNPVIHYSKGQRLFDSGNFASSAEQFLAAGKYKDAASRARTSTRAQYYADGDVKFASGEYADAVELFKKAAGYKDAEDRAAEAQLGVHYIAAENAFASGNFESAISEFENAQGFLDAEKMVLASTYAFADKYEKNRQYEKAVDTFASVGTYSDAKDRIFAIGLARLKAEDYPLAEKAFKIDSSKKNEDYYNYTHGKSLLNQNQYDEAKSCFSKCNVEDAADLCIACDYLTAEEYYQDGALNTAKKIFEQLPKDYSYNNGEKVSSRLNNLEQYKSFVALCGTWEPTDNDIESRNIYKRTGSWDSWYYTSVLPDQEITIKCIINSDSSVTIKGDVKFYRFTDYSSLKEYCTASKTTKTFTIRNVDNVPASYVIDSNTTLKFANNIFEISYYVKDEYSTSFYNTYTSRVTFGALRKKL